MTDFDSHSGSDLSTLIPWYTLSTTCRRPNGKKDVLCLRRGGLIEAKEVYVQEGRVVFCLTEGPRPLAQTRYRTTEVRLLLPHPLKTSSQEKKSRQEQVSYPILTLPPFHSSTLHVTSHLLTTSAQISVYVIVKTVV